MQTAIDELLELFQLLHQDVETCIAVIQRESVTNIVDPFIRRAYVRSVFAFIEGVTCRMKLLAFEDKDKLGVSFSPAELAFLLEKDFEINEKGEVISVPAKIPLLKNMRFAFNAIARATSISFDLKVGDGGWDALKKAAKIRDRLMHPKSIDHLFVSQDDLDLVIKGSTWFVQNFHECFRLIRDSLQAELDKSRYKDGTLLQ
jgi:hypothetical protein